MIVTIQWIKDNYEKYRTQCFSDNLPPTNTMTFNINNSKKTFGYASYKITKNSWTGEYNLHDFGITMSNYYDSPEEVKLNTLIHEMIHIEDYYKHPEHFVGRTGRSYDAHGPIFFLKEAARLKSFGFNIQKLITSDEIEASHLSDSNKAKLQKKLDKGISVYAFEFCNPTQAKNGKFYKYGYCKVGSNENKIVADLLDISYSHFKWLKKYISKSEKINNVTTSSRGSYYFCYDINELMEKYELQFVKTLYIKEGYESHEPETIKNEPIQTSQLHTFRMSLTNGKTFEFKYKDDNELFNKLKEIFPKFSDDTLNKILNNQKFKINENMNKIRISESIIKHMVEEVLNRISETDNNQINKKQFKKKINNNTIEIITI